MEFFGTNKEEEKEQLDHIATKAIKNANYTEDQHGDMDMLHKMSEKAAIDEKIIDIEKLFDKSIEELENGIIAVNGYALNSKTHDKLQDEIQEAADEGSDDYAGIARKTALLASYKNQIHNFETLNDIDPKQRKEIVAAYDRAVETLDKLEAMIRVAKKDPSLN